MTQKLPWLALLVFWAIVIMLIAGCACPEPDYRPIPAWMVPVKPIVPTVKSDDLTCLSDEVYIQLAERDRVCWQHVRELRALLGTAP